MRLIDLDPQWIMCDGARIGFTFISPQGGKDGQRVYRQSCFLNPPRMREQLAAFAMMHGEDAIVQPCNSKEHWRITGGIEEAMFENMTVQPSLDGSAGGLWHGFITNGEIK